MRSPELVPLESVPEADIIELLRVSLGSEALRTVEFWRWKHRDNPFGTSPGLVAVDEGGRPVALRVFLRWQLESAGRPVQAVRAVDTATHPGWQRRGLFRTLTLALVDRLAAEGVELIFNTPNPRSLRGYLSMGWSAVGRVPLALRVRRPGPMVRGYVRGGADVPLSPEGLEDAAAVLARPEFAGLLGGRDNGDARLRTRRTAAYLRWRYGAVPAFRYGALGDSRGASKAVAIFRLRLRSGARELSVSELLTDGSADSIRMAAGLCRQAAAATSCHYVVASAARGTAERRCLWRAGFLPLPGVGPILAVRRLGPPAEPDPRRGTSWRLAIGDIELF